MDRQVKKMRQALFGYWKIIREPKAVKEGVIHTYEWICVMGDDSEIMTGVRKWVLRNSGKFGWGWEVKKVKVKMRDGIGWIDIGEIR